MKRLAPQTGLPDDVAHSELDPSSWKGYASPQDPLESGINRAGNHVFNSYGYVANVDPVIILGGSWARRYLCLQNNGSVPAYFGFGSVPRQDGVGAFVLAPNSGITFENGIVPNNEVYVVASAVCHITVIEGRRALNNTREA